ncbi:hypothetical protein [Victivallis sp. Marseille-Q1083]|uniref:hypothetical protein n=1 Tax=Victivallis sp. Marseille-Q1083 TaxID=2717288 RepID=UPI00158A5CBD|nr:hypothetical protein [Victivallis sp. Marseille-Q1083]
MPVRLRSGRDGNGQACRPQSRGDGRQALELSLEHGFIRSELACVAANTRRPNRAAGITG